MNKKARVDKNFPCVKIFTDGACSGNPGPGGWGAILRWKNEEREIWGGEPNTTNNRMELLAAIKALDKLNYPTQVYIYTDSKYVKEGITNWIKSWKKRNWKTASKKPVKNVDLWKILDELAAKHDITWHWVKGHAGNVDNERADELARQGIREVHE